MNTCVPFWKSKKLDEMSHQEWESVCDGCGRCCLVKLQDEYSGEIFTTGVACRLLDTQSCRCTDYTNRKLKVSDCLNLKPLTNEIMAMLPKSCAYKRLQNGESLSAWHPLISGNSQSVVDAEISVKDQAISEKYIHPHDLEEYIIEL